jgi:gamma-glutamylcyclotransferase
MYYFAYGSNMNWPQMQRRCPSSRFISIGRLINYQFGITRHSRLRDCGTANIYPVPGESVWGIVFDIAEPELVLLDRFKDGYHRAIPPVFAAEKSNQPLDALVYVAAIECDVPLPNRDYKRLMIEGARHGGLPAAYRIMLEALETAPDTEQDPSVNAALRHRNSKQFKPLP